MMMKFMLSPVGGYARYYAICLEAQERRHLQHILDRKRLGAEGWLILTVLL